MEHSGRCRDWRVHLGFTFGVGGVEKQVTHSYQGGGAGGRLLKGFELVLVTNIESLGFWGL